MNDLQAEMQRLSDQWRQERSETQMTLGKLISALKELPSETVIEGFGSPHSYRGYYSDLAFEKTKEPTTAGKALVMVQECMGEIFEGYKGGEYVMSRNTPVWIANYGSCGDKIMSLQPNGALELVEEVWD